jgi:hypothetical protein
VASCAHAQALLDECDALCLVRSDPTKDAPAHLSEVSHRIDQRIAAGALNAESMHVHLAQRPAPRLEGARESDRTVIANRRIVGEPQSAQQLQRSAVLNGGCERNGTGIANAIRADTEVLEAREAAEQDGARLRLAHVRDDAAQD